MGERAAGRMWCSRPDDEIPRISRRFRLAMRGSAPDHSAYDGREIVGETGHGR